MKTFAIHFIIAFVADYLILKHTAAPLPYNATSAVLIFLGIMLLLWLSAIFYHRAYFRKLPKAIVFFFYFLKELISANLKIAYDIITPRLTTRPAIIAYPLTIQTDREITVLAILITLTPGTLSIDLSEDKTILYVHALYIEHHDLEELKHKIKHGFERRLMELTA